MNPPPLAGFRVLDLTWNLPGPYTSFQLAALGAEVTKIEPPKGDPARHVPGLYEPLNRGKHVITLDLRDDGDRRCLEDLIRETDVVLEGFRPGVAERLGCGPEQVAALNPRAVYCSITAFGRSGERAPLPAHDLNVQALSGACHLARDASGRPHGMPLPLADLSASMAAVSSICAALLARERDGRGRALDVGMLDAILSWTVLWSRGVDFAGEVRRRTPRSGRGLVRRMVERLDRQRLHALPHYDLFRCRDGRWLALGIVDEDHFWGILCRELGLRGVGRWKMQTRLLAGPLLRPLIAARLLAADRASWLERLGRAGVPVTPVLTPEEALKDGPVRSRMVEPDGTHVRAPLPDARPPGWS
ncbi:MAG: CoA transferase [Myxococcales bacterium]|nr:CoA transferase [Myxococcales bacterium]